MSKDKIDYVLKELEEIPLKNSPDPEIVLKLFRKLFHAQKKDPYESGRIAKCIFLYICNNYEKIITDLENKLAKAEAKCQKIR